MDLLEAEPHRGPKPEERLGWYPKLLMLLACTQRRVVIAIIDDVMFASLMATPVDIKSVAGGAHVSREI